MMATRTTNTAAIVTLAVLLRTPSAAQLNGGNIKGDAGLKSGSQPPPGCVRRDSALVLHRRRDLDGYELLRGSLDSAVFVRG
jgi:hypothetical protein